MRVCMSHEGPRLLARAATMYSIQPHNTVASSANNMKLPRSCARRASPTFFTHVKGAYPLFIGNIYHIFPD